MSSTNNVGVSGEIPNALKYRTTKPQGFPNAIKEVSFIPVNTQNAWIPGEPIRWEIKSNGFLDPHTTRLNFEVAVDDLSPDEIRRLDGSAHSFFSELTIWVRGVQIENIREYDVLSGILHDLNWNPSDRIVKAHEGHGVSDLSQGEFSHRQFDGDFTSVHRSFNREQKLSYDPTESRHAFGAAPEMNGLVLNSTQTSQAQFDDLTSLIHGTSVSSTAPWNGTSTATVITTTTLGEQLVFFGQTTPILYNTAVSGTYEIQQNHPQTVTTAGIFHHFGTVRQFSKNEPCFAIPSEGYLRNGWLPGYTKNQAMSTLDRITLLKDGCGIAAQNNQSVYGFSRFPSLWTTLQSTNRNRREAALVLYSAFGQFYQRKQPLRTYLMSGYYKTAPWTYNRDDHHEAFEYPPDYKSIANYDLRKESKWLVEPGRGQTLIEYADDGYKQPYNPIYCSGLDEVYFAGTDIQVNRIFKGKLVKQQGRKFLSFSVPLLSAIFGVLLPSELYKLIPMNIMEDLVIELRLNNYALFSSGYKSQIFTGNPLQNEIIDVSGVGHLKYQQVQNSRLYRITRMEMIADVLSFTPSVEQLISSQYQGEGIFIQTQGFVLGPQTQYATTQQVAGTHQLNYSFNSIKSIFWRYMPTDYEKYSFCRKQFALSHNVTNIKLQLGQDFLPLDGIRGNGGTPFGTENERYGSNKEFYNQMLQAFNKLHSLSGNMSINPFNFAVNDRCYDPTAKGSYYSIVNITDSNQNDIRTRANYLSTALASTGIESLDPSQNVINDYELVVTNAHTALQLPGFHETRLKGRCLYAVDTESLRTDWGFISGLNTYDFKPFNFVIEVDNDQSKHFPRESRIWMYFHYDTVIQFKSGMAPVVFGKS